MYVSLSAALGAKPALPFVPICHLPDGLFTTDTPPHLSDMIDKATKEIKQDEDKTVYKSLDEIADDLPDHSPRFVLLSYPLTLVRRFLP